VWAQAGDGPAGADPAGVSATRPARTPGTRKHVPPRMSFAANDCLKVGMDLSVGGAITHLSAADDPAANLINSWDLGRQVQMSYYSGPVPYTVPGHAGPPEAWKHIGWNPIQVGDDYGNPSRVLDHRNDGRELYVKCVPMQWPLDDVPGECTFECWATVDGPAVRVRCRLTMARADATQWPARTQELPAVYSNGRWHRLFTYAGDRPFENDAVVRVEHPFTPASPWAHWQATERWAALVDDADRGLGVWSPGCVRFSGGFAGKPGAGGPADASTGYLAPNRDEVLDHNLVHEYEYALVVGNLKEIRRWVYAQPDRPAGTTRPATATRPAIASRPADAARLARPTWRFDRDRQGWHYRNATDAGWPIRGVLDVDLSGRNPQIVGPATTWRAADAPRLVLDAAYKGAGVTRAAVYWATAADAGFSAKRVAVFDVKGDGVARAYEADLAKADGYQGLITQLRIDPLGAGRPGDRVVIAGVRLAGPR
jgi:hypothetical protein